MNTSDKRDGQALRLLVVDPMFHSRESLATYLQLHEDLEVIGEADLAAGAIHNTRQHRPDVVILDVNLPDVDGFTTTRQLLAMDGPPAVILLTVHHSLQEMLQAQEAGAEAYIEKSAGVDEILDALQKLEKTTRNEFSVSR